MLKQWNTASLMLPIKNFVHSKVFFQLLKYLVSGLTAFIVEYATFRLFLDVMDLQKFISNSIAMFIGFWFSFLLNRFWSFKSQEKLVKQLSLYGLLFFINLVLSNMLMYVFSDMLGMQPSIAKVVIMAMIVAWNFILYKKIIYRR